MKSKFFYVAFFVIIIIVNIVICIRQQKTMSQLTQVHNEMEAKRVENILLKEGFFHMYDFENISIDLSIPVRNINGDTTILKNLLEGENTLVLFIRVGSCNSCINSNLDFIRNVNKEMKVLLGLSGLTMNEFKSFVSQNNLKDTLCYLLPDERFEGFKINPIVYFVVDVNLRTKYFYAPSIVFPELTKIYIDKVQTMINITH